MAKVFIYNTSCKGKKEKNQSAVPPENTAHRLCLALKSSGIRQGSFEDRGSSPHKQANVGINQGSDSRE